MAGDPDLDRILKKHGLSTGGADEPAKPGPKGGAQAAPAKDEGSDDEGWLSYIGGGLKSGAKGVAEGLGGELESAAEFIPGYKDTSVAEWMREKTTPDADEEGSLANKAGRFVGESLPFMAIPEFGLGARLGTLAARAFPKVVRGAAGRFATNPSQVGRFARAAAPVVGRGTELGGIGAVSGAIADPEHPVQGAATGALAGVTPIGLGALARSAPAQRMATHMMSHRARHATAWAASGIITNMMGLGHIGWAVYPAVAWGPVGGAIRSGAHYIVNSSGRIVSQVPDSIVRRAENAVAAGAGSLGGSLASDIAGPSQ